MQSNGTLASNKHSIYLSMDESKPTLALSNVNSSTWGERLLLNLLSYSLILGPMIFTVLATRYRLCPNPIQSSALIQRFVYGSIQQSKTRESDNLKGSNERLLLDENRVDKRKLSPKETKPSNTTLSFIWCFIGLQLSYLVWGVLQEKIMTTEYQVTNELVEKQKHLDSPSGNSRSQYSVITFHDSQFLVFINRVIAFILSIVALVYNRPRKSQLYSGKQTHHHQEPIKPQAPLYEYVYCSLSNILSSWCQYEALKYVNFPTQVLSKSCKIIPVMLMSKIMLHKRYQYKDYFFALLLSLGMFIFLINQPGTTKPMVGQSFDNLTTTNIPVASGQLQHVYGPHFNELSKQVRSSALISGLIILALYLAFDSFTSNWQQSLFTRYGISNWQMMAATNFYSILLTLTSLHQLGNLKPAFKLLASSRPLLIDCFLMSVMSSVGQLFVYYTIKKFGSVIFAVMMTLRQFLAILLSCAIYGHRLTLGSSVGIMLVFCVVGYQMWRKSGKSNTTRRTTPKAEASDTIRIQFKPQAE